MRHFARVLNHVSNYLHIYFINVCTCNAMKTYMFGGQMLRAYSIALSSALLNDCQKKKKKYNSKIPNGLDWIDSSTL